MCTNKPVDDVQTDALKNACCMASHAGDAPADLENMQLPEDLLDDVQAMFLKHAKSRSCEGARSGLQGDEVPPALNLRVSLMSVRCTDLGTVSWKGLHPPSWVLSILVGMYCVGYQRQKWRPPRLLLPSHF